MSERFAATKSVETHPDFERNFSAFKNLQIVTSDFLTSNLTGIFQTLFAGPQEIQKLHAVITSSHAFKYPLIFSNFFSKFLSDNRVNKFQVCPIYGPYSGRGNRETSSSGGLSMFSEPIKWQYSCHVTSGVDKAMLSPRKQSK